MDLMQLIRYEQGDLDQIEIIELFSDLISSGQAWNLQGHYGRTASALIAQGIITENGNITHKTKIAYGIE